MSGLFGSHLSFGPGSSSYSPSPFGGLPHTQSASSTFESLQNEATQKNTEMSASPRSYSGGFGSTFLGKRKADDGPEPPQAKAARVEASQVQESSKGGLGASSFEVSMSTMRDGGRDKTEDKVNSGAYDCNDKNHKQAPFAAQGHELEPTEDNEGFRNETLQVNPTVHSKQVNQDHVVEAEDAVDVGEYGIQFEHGKPTLTPESSKQDGGRKQDEMLDLTPSVHGIIEHPSHSETSPTVDATKNLKSYSPSEVMDPNHGGNKLERNIALSSFTETNLDQRVPVALMSMPPSNRRTSLLHSLDVLLILSVLLALLSFLFSTLPHNKVDYAIKSLVNMFREIGQSFQRVVELVICHVVSAIVDSCYIALFPFKLLYDGYILDSCMLLIMVTCVWRLRVAYNMRYQRQ